MCIINFAQRLRKYNQIGRQNHATESLVLMSWESFCSKRASVWWFTNRDVFPFCKRWNTIPAISGKNILTRVERRWNSKDRLNALKLRNRDYEFLSICSFVHPFPYLSIYLNPFVSILTQRVTLSRCEYPVSMNGGRCLPGDRAKRVETSKSKNVASVAANRREKADVSIRSGS